MNKTKIEEKQNNKLINKIKKLKDKMKKENCLFLSIVHRFGWMRVLNAWM